MALLGKIKDLDFPFKVNNDCLVIPLRWDKYLADITVKWVIQGLVTLNNWFLILIRCFDYSPNADDGVSWIWYEFLSIFEES
jgi:hypothetical protein